MREQLILRGGMMNKERVKGAIDEVAGSAKRHFGSLTGNTGTQVRGAVQQVKGKAETAVGKLKDAVHNAKDNAAAQHKRNEEVKHEKREVIIVDDRPVL
jgi:uncharacterized protein YjbJ (UPF0337 family)